MHKLFIDINVILDVALSREPYYMASQKLLSYVERKKAKGYFSAVSCPIIYYILQKEIGHKKSVEYIRNLLKLLSVVEVNAKVIEIGLQLGLKDFEDSVQIASAETCKADYIITRDFADYKKSPFPFVSPAEYLVNLEML